jgi:hypothetical protein
MATGFTIPPPTKDQKMNAFEQLIIYLVDWYGELDDQLAQQIVNKYNKILKSARLSTRLFIYKEEESPGIYIDIAESDDIPVSIISWIASELLTLDEDNPHATDCPVLMGEINHVLETNNINLLVYPLYSAETNTCTHDIRFF